MFYLALTFWLMVGLLEAFAIFRLWEGLVRPRWIHLVLLPGTVVAETAHFLAALLTGAPVREAKLVSDEPVGLADEPPGPQGIPVLSPLLLALLPIVAGVVVIYLLYGNFDRSVVAAFQSAGLRGPSVDSQLTQSLTWRLGGWFQVGRDLLSLAERLVAALPLGGAPAGGASVLGGGDSGQTWKSWLFIYLTACLAIRMVPLRGNLRSGMAAIVLVGLLATGLGKLAGRVDRGLHEAWPLLAYAIALLTLLLLVSLLVRGLVGLGYVLADKQRGVS